MNRRTRTLAGALALVAMTLSLGEVGMASACASMADMGGMVMDGSGDDSKAPMGCPLAAGDHREGRDGHCPLSPAVDAGCVAPATLPSSPSAIIPSPPVAARATIPQVDRPALILATALFRPPRA